MSANGNIRRLRCAIYTRKSTEDGLDQEFNSLDAQHEACAAYIASQASLGWKLVPDRYDDGGISGGTMERPALQRLLDDLRERRVDVVVVYKIDRLTRSLSDFARIVEVFDQAEASFVSVTQQFNTTTSMGRLTLNVLLSFAQFEREVTAERIRDKIAASKKKGMWMGGTVPLGYRPENRKLVVHQEEAEIVRFLFRRYLELKSVRALSAEASTGQLGDALRQIGSGLRLRSFCRGNLYHMLANPIYVGKIRHREQVHDGLHEAIIDRELFDAVQSLLQIQAPRRRSESNTNGAHLLTGLVRDEHGHLLRSAQTSKDGLRYRYYVSRQKVEERGTSSSGWRLPAHELESIVEHQLIQFLGDCVQLSEWIRESHTDEHDQTHVLKRSAAMVEALQAASAADKATMMSRLIRGIELRPGQITIVVNISAVVEELTARISPVDKNEPRTVRIACPFSLRRRGVGQKIVMRDRSAQHPRPDAALIDLVLRANQYLHQLTEDGGRSLSDVALINRTDLSEVSRLLPLAFLNPTLVDGILAGRQSENLTAMRLSRIAGLPLSWSQQLDSLAR